MWGPPTVYTFLHLGLAAFHVLIRTCMEFWVEQKKIVIDWKCFHSFKKCAAVRLKSVKKHFQPALLCDGFVCVIITLFLTSMLLRWFINICRFYLNNSKSDPKSLTSLSWQNSFNIQHCPAVLFICFVFCLWNLNCFYRRFNNTHQINP